MKGPWNPRQGFFLGVLFALFLGAGQALPTEPPLITVLASSNIYYVATHGNDSNPGTAERPWRTIQKAADTLRAGDTVYIKGGTYRERVEARNSGYADNYIVYASSPGETAVMDGAEVILPEWAGLFEVVGRSYLRISGLRIRNAGPMPHNPGLLVEDSSHIIVEGNFVSNTSDSGIAVWNSYDVTVEDNEVEGACTQGFNECISVGGTDMFEIRNNRVHRSQKEGITVKDGSSNGRVWGNIVHHTEAVGVYVDAWDKHTFNIEVFANIVHDIAANGFALASEQGGLLENIHVYNNIAYHNKWVGLHLIVCCSAIHPLANIRIVNNTFADNGDGWGGGILLENPQAKGVVILNNICSQNLSFQIAVDGAVPAGNFSIAYNLIDGFRGGQDEVLGDHFVQGDPIFKDPAGGDFHILPPSPAIDSGSSAGSPDRDFEGQPRPYGAGTDIGADEYVGSGRKKVPGFPR
jgi:parallel beta-helix repeat protein